ncbi:hypothetical protein [Dyella sp.]|uniref:hypothetical protein n=1 Tax=Dyella sp. TaxID=1869338 RepID=UPI002ED26C09
MTKRIGGAKVFAIGLALAGMVAAPLSASAHGWGGGYRGGYGYHGGYHGYYGGYHRGGYWSGGRWIAGAIVAGATAAVVSDALRPAPVYYGPRVVYTQPTTVVYDSAPVVTRRVVETRTVYEDPGYTRYVRDDGY